MAQRAGSGGAGDAARAGRSPVLNDPLAALIDIRGVAEACAIARDEVDGLLWDRRARGRTAELTTRSIRLGARESAAIEGAEVPVEIVLDGGGVDSSPIGAVVGAALRVTAEVASQRAAWHTAPLQSLAALHLVVARDVLDDDRLGRPRGDFESDDPLHIGPVPSAAESVARLEALARVLTTPTQAPGILVAGIVHAELLALRPFAWGSGLVARAATRLVLCDRGVDPGNLVAYEHGLRSLGRASYVAAVRSYIGGSPEGVAEWLIWHAGAIGFAASEARAAL